MESESSLAPRHSAVTDVRPLQVVKGPDGYVNIRISRKCLNELERIQEQSLLRTRGQVVDYLVQTAQTKSPVIPSATLDGLFADDVPIQLCGRSGEGKSRFLKQILPDIPHPAFLIDTVGEFPKVKKLSIGDLYSFKWYKANYSTRVRFVPTNNAQIATSELRTVFQFLNTEKMRQYQPNKNPSGVLSKWVFVVEESHRLSHETHFLNFLLEARKFTKKIICVASDPDLYGRVCRLLRPPALPLDGTK